MNCESIRFNNVTLKVGAKTVLRNLNGTIREGAITVLVGPSGSGKSSLLSMCNLMRTPTTGEVFVEQREIRTWSVRQLRQSVGMVYQSPTMFPGTVEENLLYGVRLHNTPLPDVNKLLNDLSLDVDILHQAANNLSGGQKQRVALGRTLAMKPAILLLDEATSALDEAAKADVEHTLLHLNKRHKITLVWVTHDVQQANRVADTIWHLENGEIREA